MSSEYFPELPDLDLGLEHGLRWITNAAGAVVGATIQHPAGGADHKPAGAECIGSVFWIDQYGGPVWALEGAADEHITLSPSVRCGCGDHGFIRAGRWVPA